jgi:hypothetical protein
VLRVVLVAQEVLACLVVEAVVQVHPSVTQVVLACPVVEAATQVHPLVTVHPSVAQEVLACPVVEVVAQVHPSVGQEVLAFQVVLVGQKALAFRVVEVVENLQPKNHLHRRHLQMCSPYRAWPSYHPFQNRLQIQPILQAQLVHLQLD